MNSLASIQEQTHEKYSNEYLQLGNVVDKNNETLNQALNDAMLNAMASLVDYYYVYCMIKIGIGPEKVRKVQYRALTKKLLIENSDLPKDEKTKFPLQLLREKFNEKISNASNLEIDKINIHEYWICFLGNAISRTIYEYGILDDKRLNLDFDSNKGRFNIKNEMGLYHHLNRHDYCRHS